MVLEPLDRDFFTPSAREVAPNLLGHWLIRRIPEGVSGGPIVETEAYLVDDPASHGAVGLTARNRAMFGPPGRAYVYLIYGYHFCVNAVCAGEGIAEAVLVRAIAPEFGLSFMHQQRPNVPLLQLTNGPAKVCEALDINRHLDASDLCKPDSPLVIARNPDVERWRAEAGPVVITSRVGISRAASLPLRFYAKGSPFVSRKAKLIALG